MDLEKGLYLYYQANCLLIVFALTLLNWQLLIMVFISAWKITCSAIGLCQEGIRFRHFSLHDTRLRQGE